MVMIGMNGHIYHSWWPQMVTTRFQSNIKYLGHILVMIGMNQHIYHSWWPQMVTHVFSLTSSTQDTYGYGMNQHMVTTRFQSIKV